MKKFILSAAFLLFAHSASALVEGNYTIAKGANANGSRYGGTVVISKSGNSYQLNWLLADSGEQYSGVGILRDNILSVGWGSGNSVGVVSYKVEGDTLNGTWTIAPGGRLGIEVLKKAR